jgi:hypothetical protein
MNNLCRILAAIVITSPAVLAAAAKPNIHNAGWQAARPS